MFAFTVAAPRAVVTTRRDGARRGKKPSSPFARVAAPVQRRRRVTRQRRQQCVRKWCKQCHYYYALQRPHSCRMLQGCAGSNQHSALAAACDGCSSELSPGAFAGALTLRAATNSSGEAANSEAFWHELERPNESSIAHSDLCAAVREWSAAHRRALPGAARDHSYWQKCTCCASRSSCSARTAGRASSTIPAFSRHYAIEQITQVREVLAKEGGLRRRDAHGVAAT